MLDLIKFLLFTDNMKATIALCVFGYPSNNQTQAYTQCNDLCSGEKGTTRTALIYGMEKNNADVQYSFCEHGTFQKNYVACIECLNALPSTSGLTNCT